MWAHGWGLLWGTWRYISSWSWGVQSRGLRKGHGKSLRLLGSCRLWCQGLLGHHWSPSRVAHSTRMLGRSLGWLSGHLHGLLGHVW